MREVDYGLMFVTDERVRADEDFFALLEAALQGGVTIVQLREKQLDTRTFYERAIRAKELCHAHHVPFIINDRVDIALAIDADGVHIGQRDLPHIVTRRLLGKDKIIGLSISTPAQASAAQQYPIDYIGLSPIFSTATKQTHLAPPLGLDGLSHIRTLFDRPIVSIGGIQLENARAVIEHGSDGLAVVSAISKAVQPVAATAALKQIVSTYAKNR
ncbi:MAG: thiamine phosphate synthase [Bacteroidota bacterium]